MREEFEKWFDEAYGTEYIVDGDDDTGRALKMMAWQGWQASRAAIELELPEIGKYYAGKAGYSRIYDIHGFERDSKDVITSHGIRIKGKTE